MDSREFDNEVVCRVMYAYAASGRAKAGGPCAGKGRFELDRENRRMTLTHLRASPVYHLRKVVKAEMSTAWWDRIGNRRLWWITTECGHDLKRLSEKAPKRVRCDGCPI